MLKKLFNFFLLSNGISATDERVEADKWTAFREERKAWEHEQALQKSAPTASTSETDSSRPDTTHQ